MDLGYLRLHFLLIHGFLRINHTKAPLMFPSEAPPSHDAIKGSSVPQRLLRGPSFAQQLGLVTLHIAQRLCLEHVFTMPRSVALPSRKRSVTACRVSPAEVSRIPALPAQADGLICSGMQFRIYLTISA